MVKRLKRARRLQMVTVKVIVKVQKLAKRSHMQIHHVTIDELMTLIRSLKKKRSMRNLLPWLSNPNRKNRRRYERSLRRSRHCLVSAMMTMMILSPRRLVLQPQASPLQAWILKELSQLMLPLPTAS